MGKYQGKGIICKIGKRWDSEDGIPFVAFTIKESYRGKEKTESMFWNCMTSGDCVKQVALEQIVSFDGTVKPNNYQKDGRTIWDKSIWIKEMIVEGKPQTAPKPEKEAPEELPFD